MVLKSQVKSTAVTVTTSATVLPATALTGRQAIDIVNFGAATIYVGHSGVTVANGRPVLAGANYPIDLGDKALIYARVASGTVNVRVLEGV